MLQLSVAAEWEYRARHHLTSHRLVSRPSGRLPVASCTNPIAYGPRRPLRLPTELIRATPPPVALPVRMAVGSGQKVGAMPVRPPEIGSNATIVATERTATSDN